MRTERLGEYEEREVAATLTATDLNFLAQDAVRAAIRVSRPLRGDGFIVKATDAVGVVELSALRIEVVPKLVGGERMLAQLLDLLLPRPDPLDRERAITFEGRNLFDLVVSMLAEEADVVLRRGILHDYHGTQAPLTALRGRVMADQQITKRYGRWDRVWCRYDAFAMVTAENLRLRDALTDGARWTRSKEVRAHARRLATVLDDACESKPRGSLTPIATDRRNAYYWPAIPLADLVLGRRSISDVFSARQGRLRSFFIGMNRLFERLVEVLFERVAEGLVGWRMVPQAVDRSTLTMMPSGRRVEIRPDVLLEAPEGGRLPVDAKYKLYDKRPVSASDLQQLALYAFANRSDETGTALLVHPTQNPIADRTVVVRDRRGHVGSHIKVVGIQLEQLVRELAEPRLKQRSIRRMARVLAASDA